MSLQLTVVSTTKALICVVRGELFVKLRKTKIRISSLLLECGHPTAQRKRDESYLSSHACISQFSLHFLAFDVFMSKIIIGD